MGIEVYGKYDSLAVKEGRGSYIRRRYFNEDATKTKISICMWAIYNIPQLQNYVPSIVVGGS